MHYKNDYFSAAKTCKNKFTENLQKFFKQFSGQKYILKNKQIFSQVKNTIFDVKNVEDFIFKNIFQPFMQNKQPPFAKNIIILNNAGEN